MAVVNLRPKKAKGKPHVGFYCKKYRKNLTVKDVKEHGCRYKEDCPHLVVVIL